MQEAPSGLEARSPMSVGTLPIEFAAPGAGILTATLLPSSQTTDVKSATRQPAILPDTIIAENARHNEAQGALTLCLSPGMCFINRHS